MKPHGCKQSFLSYTRKNVPWRELASPFSNNIPLKQCTHILASQYFGFLCPLNYTCIPHTYHMDPTWVNLNLCGGFTISTLPTLDCLPTCGHCPTCGHHSHEPTGPPHNLPHRAARHMDVPHGRATWTAHMDRAQPPTHGPPHGPLSTWKSPHGIPTWKPRH